MQQVRTERGRPRDVRLASYETFDSVFETGIDPAKWTETGYPWIEDDPECGQQLAINEERQHYVTRRDLIEHQSYRPWFVNAAGHLVLRCQPTPARYRGMAYAVLDTYRIVALDRKRRRVTIAGRPWLEFATGLMRTGVHRELRDNPYLPGASYLVIEGDTRRLAYLRIESEPVEDPPVSTGIPTRHVIELIDDIPAGLAVVPGSTTLKLLRRQPMVSGMLTTRRAFAQCFGSVHVRMRLPSGRGTLAGALAWPVTEALPGGTSAAEFATGVNLLEQPGHGRAQYHSLYTPGTELGAYHATSVPGCFLHPVSLDAHAHHVVVEIKPGAPGHVDARGHWVEILWDWYPNDTCAWFVKVGDEFLETARMRMPTSGPYGPRTPRMIVLKNAFDSWFNRACELRDAPAGLVECLRTPPPWDFEIAFVRVSQWAGYPPRAHGSGPLMPVRRAARAGRAPDKHSWRPAA